MKDEMWILGLEAAPNQLFRILRFEKATHDIGMVLPVWNASLPTLEHRTDCKYKYPKHGTITPFNLLLWI